MLPPLARRMYPRSTNFSIVSALVAGVPSPFSFIADAKSSSSMFLPACSIKRKSPASLSRPFGLERSSLNSKSLMSALHGFSGSVFHPSGRSCFLGRTALQPAVLMVRTSLRKRSPPSKAVRFWTSHTAGGYHDARKVRVIRSYNFLWSALGKPSGILPVGIMAKWSLTLASSKLRPVFFNPSEVNVELKGLKSSCAPSCRMIFEISSFISFGRCLESVLG